MIKDWEIRGNKSLSDSAPVLVSASKSSNWLTKVLDVFAFLTLVAELEAAGWVAADLSAGHLAVAKRFGDDHVLVHAAICSRTQTHTHIWFKSLKRKKTLTNPALESVQTESTCIRSQVRVHVHVHVHHGVHRAEEVPSHAGHGQEQAVEALERIVEYRVNVSGVTASQKTGEEEARAELSLFSHLRDNKKMKWNNDFKRCRPGVLQLDLNPKATTLLQHGKFCEQVWPFKQRQMLWSTQSVALLFLFKFKCKCFAWLVIVARWFRIKHNINSC